MLEYSYDDDDDEEEGGDEEGYLASYSDLVTDLMAVFVLLLSFALLMTSTIAYSSKAADGDLDPTAIEDSLSSKVAQDQTEQGGNMDSEKIENDFDQLYEAIKEKLEVDGFGDSVVLERTETYINFQFREHIIFYPDSAKMRETGEPILAYIGSLLKDIDSSINEIQISGHTARVGPETKINLFSWELSSNRALTVLKFFVTECDLSQSKFSTTGFSCNKPVAPNDVEENRSKNRRVEMRVIRAE